MSDQARAEPAAASDWIDDVFEALAGDELSGSRAEALSRFRDTGFPTTRMEAWKYTNLRKLARRRFVRAPEAPRSVPEDPSALLIDGLTGATHLFADGRHLAKKTR